MTCFKRIYGLMGRTDIFFLGLVLLLIFSTVFTADAEVFYSEGTYPVISGKKFPAQRFAHTEAFTSAVSQAIDRILPKENGEKFDKSEILKGPFPFVRKEDLLERSIDSHDIMKIALRVDIDMGKLHDRLRSEGVKIDKKASPDAPALLPKLIIVFGEEIDGQVSKFPYSSQVMHDFLNERHFDVLLDEVIKRDIKNELAIQGMLRGDTREALNLAHNVGAVVVLSGKLSIQTFGGGAGKNASYVARVSFQAINADSGRIIASVKHKIRRSCEKSERGVRQCIAIATRETGKQLIYALENEFNGGKSSRP